MYIYACAWVTCLHAYIYICIYIHSLQQHILRENWQLSLTGDMFTLANMHVYAYIGIHIYINTYSSVQQQELREKDTHRTAKRHRTQFAKEPYKYWLFCEKRLASYGILYMVATLQVSLTGDIFTVVNIHDYVHICIYSCIYICTSLQQQITSKRLIMQFDRRHICSCEYPCVCTYMYTLMHIYLYQLAVAEYLKKTHSLV